MEFEPKNTIGRNIRRLRQKEGWSQAMLAGQLDLSVPALSKIETGITDCPWTRIRQMAAIFSVHVTAIVLEEDEFVLLGHSDEIVGLNEKMRVLEQEIIRLQTRTIGLYEEITGARKFA